MFPILIIIIKAHLARYIKIFVPSILGLSYISKVQLNIYLQTGRPISVEIAGESSSTSSLYVVKKWESKASDLYLKSS